MQNLHLFDREPFDIQNHEEKLTQAKIYQEWVIGSGVDPAIVKLNVKALHSDEVYEYLTSENSKRLNTGRLASNLLKRYELAANDGGWWVSGVDPITGERMQWGQFKPNTPRIDIKKNKPIKYEAPDGVPTRVFFLEVPRHIWELISQKYNCPIDSSEHFWGWVIKNNLPITVMEGAKKAAAALTIGVIAVAVSGVYNATRKVEDSFKRELAPDLQHFATPNRSVFSCFDTDKKAKTRAYVAKASKVMLEAFDFAGCEAKFISLPSNGDKVGADDFIVNHGGEKFHELYKYARNWSIYKSFLGFAKNLFTPKPRNSNKRELTPPTLPIQAEYKAGERLEALLEALSDHKFVLLGDQVGFGKSTFIGKLNPEDLNAKNIYYLSPTHRNPTTPEVAARYTDLPVRNNGLYKDEKGNIRWAQKGEIPNLPGNCTRTPIFHELARKGYNEEVRQTASVNPICKTCPVFWNCRGTTLDGTPTKQIDNNTFLRDRKLAHSAPLIRTSIESLAPFEKEETEQPSTTYENILVIDELSQITGVEVQNITKKEVDLTIAKLAKAGIYEQFKWVGQLRELMNDTSRYGLNHDEICNHIALDQISDSEYLGMLVAASELNVNLLEELLHVSEADRIDVSKMGHSERKKYRAILRTANKQLASEQLKKFRNHLEDMIPNWLATAIKALREGHSLNYLRIKHGQLEITKPDNHVRALMESADKIIILDATATINDVVRKLGARHIDCFALRQELPQLTNLTIVQVRGMGHLGKQRSDDKIARINALKAELATRHEQFGSIDIKACKNEGEGHWGLDNRGSNEYKSCDGLLLVGDPYKDIGAMKAQFTILESIRAMNEYPEVATNAGGVKALGLDSRQYIETFLTDDSFQSFIAADVASEVIQGVGRTRPYNRDEPITVYIATDSDLSYLQQAYPGCTIKTTTAFEITPQAGDRVQRLKWNILEAARKLHDEGKKITAVNIANSIGCHKSRISQICAEFGGSKRFLKSLISLLKALYRDIKLFDSSNLDDDELWFAQQYLPLLLNGSDEEQAEAVEEIITKTPPERLEATLAAIPTEYKAKLLIAFLRYLPSDIYNQFGMRLHGIT